MAMTLLNTVTLSAETFQFEWTNIPQTGKDLLVVVSARLNTTGPTEAEIKLNGVQSNLSWRGLRGTGTVVGSSTNTNYSNMSYVAVIPGTGATTNTFSNFQVYVPNYTSSTVKTSSFEGVAENNASASQLGIAAWNWNDTSAITSLAIVCSTGNMVVNSTASLYIIS